MSVNPATWQCFPGRKDKITLVECFRILRFLSTLVAADQTAAERIKQVFNSQNLNKVIIALVFQKHGALLLVPKTACAVISVADVFILLSIDVKIPLES